MQTEQVAPKGLVFDIQRFSVHDGPGIRTIVFLKGCPLRCRWCSNPESQHKDQQIMYLSQNCLHCGRCVEACPTKALSFQPGFRIDASQCDMCGKCVDVCFSQALHMAGRFRSVEDVIEELKKDQIHYRRSGGGITLSGGEPLFQHEFAKELLQACKARGWHTAIETTGFTSDSVLEKVLPWLDLILLDIKHMNSEKHKHYTGQSNEIIHHHAKFMSRFGIPMIIRVPVIPGFNDQPSEIREIAAFAASIRGVKELHLLPYHRLGENKYDYLQREYPLKGVGPQEKEEIITLRQVVEAEGLVCKIGG